MPYSSLKNESLKRINLFKIMDGQLESTFNMAALTKKVVLPVNVLKNVFLMSIRNSRANIQRPKPPSLARRKLLKISEPIYKPLELINECEFVRYPKQTEREPHIYEKLISEIIINNFNKSECVAIFHSNAFLDDGEFQVKKKFFKAGMKYSRYPTNYVKLAIQDTKFKPAIQLLDCLHLDCFVFFKRDLLPKLISLSKKMNEIVLIGGIVEDRLMSRRELINCSAMPDINIMHAQLSRTLETAMQITLNSLQQHPKQLSQLLSNIKMDTPSNTESS